MTEFENLMTTFTADQTPRVWSLLVTVFGELAQDDGAQISGATLSKLTAHMGIKPEAMRVALHRLRKDGWIENHRSGRTSAYSLTSWGRAQSADATPRIYNMKPVPNQAWLAIFDPAQPIPQDSDGVWITPTLLLTATKPNDDQIIAAPVFAPFPNWMANRVCNLETVASVQHFYARLNALKMTLTDMPTLDRFEISALRILIVDGWRRIVLKTPNLPDHVFPNDWAGPACRACVTDLLKAYQRQDLTTQNVDAV